MTSCRYCGVPNDLKQRRRSVAVPEKAPSSSCKPVTNKDCRANNRRTAFRCVSSANENTTAYNMHVERLESRKHARCFVPTGLGEAGNPILHWRTVASWC